MTAGGRDDDDWVFSSAEGDWADCMINSSGYSYPGLFEEYYDTHASVTHVADGTLGGFLLSLNVSPDEDPRAGPYFDVTITPGRPVTSIELASGDPAHELRVVELFQALDFHNYPDYRYTGPDGSQVVTGNRDGSWAVEGEELVPWGHFASPSVRLLINTKATHFRVYMRNASMAWSDPRGCALFRLIVRDPTDAQRVRPMVPDEETHGGERWNPDTLTWDKLVRVPFDIPDAGKASAVNPGKVPMRVTGAGWLWKFWGSGAVDDAGEVADSMIVAVAEGSPVVNLAVATTDVDFYSNSEEERHQLCIDEVLDDNVPPTIGKRLVPWGTYGGAREHSALREEEESISYHRRNPSQYKPAYIPVNSTATRFRISLRTIHSSPYSRECGCAVFIPQVLNPTETQLVSAQGFLVDGTKR